MNYIVYYDNGCWFTNWLNLEENWEDGMLVIDLAKRMYCDDGKVWQDMDFDHL